MFLCASITVIVQSCCEKLKSVYRQQQQGSTKTIRMNQSGRVSQLVDKVSQQTIASSTTNTVTTTDSSQSSHSQLPSLQQSYSAVSEHQRQSQALFCCPDCQRHVDGLIPALQLEGVLSRYNWWAVVLKDAKTSLGQVAENDLRTRNMTVRDVVNEE